MPENMLDVFNQIGFRAAALSASIMRLPYKEGRIGQMGIFQSRGIRTTSAQVEFKNGRLGLIQSTRRGEPVQPMGRTKSTIRPINSVRLALTDKIMAGDVQDLRQFGQSGASSTKAVADLVTEKLAEARQNHQYTQEYHRFGAVQGVVLDADGTTVIHDLYDLFGLTRPTLSFELGDPNTDVLGKCLALKRRMGAALGQKVRDVHVFVDDGFHDALRNHAKVRQAYERWQAGAALRDDLRDGFRFGGCVFEEYGTESADDLVQQERGHAIPMNIPGLFVENFAPADYIEAANTTGQELYAKQERMKMDRGIEIETQSNPITFGTRPEAQFLITP